MNNHSITKYAIKGSLVASLAVGFSLTAATALAAPVSYAGVARRTTRRVVRRSNVYVASLPQGCTAIVIEGNKLQQCGTTYYQASGDQYVVVIIE